MHSAALTKHYGEYATFVKANVDATSHVCELAYRAGCDLNVVSTVSVGDVVPLQLSVISERNVKRRFSEPRNVPANTFITPSVAKSLQLTEKQKEQMADNAKQVTEGIQQGNYRI